jgi:hypothetical protein
MPCGSLRADLCKPGVPESSLGGELPMMLRENHTPGLIDKAEVDHGMAAQNRVGLVSKYDFGGAK